MTGREGGGVHYLFKHPGAEIRNRTAILPSVDVRGSGGYAIFTVHGLRHTWATLHLAAGTPIKWIQARGGWSSAKLLLDTYGHFIPQEMRGFEDALAPKDRNRPEQTGTALKLTRPAFGKSLNLL